MERNDLLNPAPSTLRASLLMLLALGAAGCSSIDCDDPTRYIGAELHAPLATPPGLDAVEVRDTFKVPGGAPPKEYQGGACLLKPPQLVGPGAVIAPRAVPTAAPAPAAAPAAPGANSTEPAIAPPAETPAATPAATSPEAPAKPPELPPTGG